MKPFKVLDRELNIHQHYLLEASAGTGKTFSIQNIVVRLLIEQHEGQDPFSLQKILVVTFTRAAARDLKIRIRKNIEQSLLDLQTWLQNGTFSENTPDYLKFLMEQGKEKASQACNSLQQALFTFDEAQIFTIHSFFTRMLFQFALESDMSLESQPQDENLPLLKLKEIIHDFFCTEMRQEKYSPAQLSIILKEDPEQNTLLKLLQSGYQFPPFHSFNILFSEFKKCMQTLKKKMNLQSKKMIEDFQNQINDYRNEKGRTKGETLAKAIQFVQLFDKEEWDELDFDQLISDGLVWTEALNIDLLKKKSAPLSHLHYPQLTQHLASTLQPLVDEARNSLILMARVAGDCQSFLKRFLNEEEKFFPDDILRKMSEALDRPFFQKQIQASYQAAIIDEFQDTDPIQWQIFQRLFLSEKAKWQGYLYLVGDPKQSIYSFRQADIYTYLSAAQALGPSHCYSLNINYRSQPQLIQALNALFSCETLPHCFSLPKKSISIAYKPVEFAKGKIIFEDERGAIHFCIADAEDFPNPKMTDLEIDIYFPFIANEIFRLKSEKSFEFRQFAVLVRDRHQALRLSEFFTNYSIPHMNQKGTSLANSIALQALIHLFEALIHPKDIGAIRLALSSPIFGWTYEELKKCDAYDFVVILILKLRKKLFEEGFSYFFQGLLQTISKPNALSIQEQILSREGGIDLYRDLLQIADIIVDNRYREWNTPEDILPFLHQLYVWEENENPKVKRFQNASEDKVKIISLHCSKGLEFDIVFALGLMNRVPNREELIPEEKNGKLFLSPYHEKSEKYLQHCEEVDAEKMRQLYVAFTRAKMQLHLFFALNFPSEKLKYGEASPIELFLARLNQPDTTYQALYDRIKFSSEKSLVEFFETYGKKYFITYKIHKKIKVNEKRDREDKFLALKPPPNIILPKHSVWVTSFSQLSQNVEKKEDRVLDPPNDIFCHEKNIHTLPSNRELGVLIHHILEKIKFLNFNELKNEEQAIPLIRPFIQSSIFRDWESVISKMIFNTLKAPLPLKTQTLCLASLKPAQIYREIPFVFPNESGEAIEEIHIHKGLIKGVIDLLFCSEGMYYLVDWKTNWLGKDENGYTKSSLKVAMEKHAYFLQASIYKEAIKRYLKIVESQPFEKCFGGIYYLFLRGITLNGETGIFHFFSDKV